jgi:hypothetical protein
MNSEEIASATCTDLPQRWGKKGSSCTQAHLYKSVPVREFCHLPKRKRRTVWVEEVPETILATVKAVMYEGINMCNYFSFEKSYASIGVSQ